MRALSVVVLLSVAFACASSSDNEPGPSPSPTTAPEAEPIAEVEGPAPAAGQPSDPTLCAVEAGDLMACKGKRVALAGTSPETVMQHPVHAGPGGPGVAAEHQGYVDTEFGQLVVLTAEPFECPGPLRVVGVVEHVDLGGEPGTKNSYSGWKLSDAVVTCE